MKQNQNSKPNNNRKPRNNGSRGNKTQNDQYFKKGGNDIGWHGDEALRTAASSISWAWATGVDIPVRSAAVSLPTGRFNMPALMAIRLASIPGVGNKFTDPINIGARAAYTEVRSKLKSANSYDPADLMMYICNCADIHQFITWLHRIYGTFPLYSFMNNQVPDNLLRMQNIDPEDFRNHALEFRSRANQIIYKASQIWMPKGFAFVERAKWLYSKYYSEGPSIKDQIYFFTPGVFRKYTWDADRDYQGMLEAYVPIPTYTDDSHLYTVDTLMNYLDDMIEAMVTDSDFQNIAGDLLNCYGENGVETFALIPEGEVSMPEVNMEVLEQIQNARCLGSISYMFSNFEDFTSYFSISQDETNNVLVVPSKAVIDISSYTDSVKGRLKDSFKLDTYEPIISVHDNPTPDKTMSVTRFTNVGTNYSENGDNITVEYDAAADLVLNIEYGYVTGGGNFKVISCDSTAHKMKTGTAAAMTSQEYIMMSPFHYHPMLNAITDGNGAPNANLMGALDVVAPVSHSNLHDMNRVDLMHQFNIKEIGKITK